MQYELKKSAVDEIIRVEGGYVNNPNDNGGPTNWGITQAVARANGFMADMSTMPREFAEKIYISRYIDKPGFDKIFDISALVGSELIDTGVNMGPATAGIFFQRWLNAFNAQSTRYSDVFVDGAIGPITAEAFKAFLAYRGPDGERTMHKALNHIQGARYLEIAERDKRQEDFVYGQVKNRT